MMDKSIKMDHIALGVCYYPEQWPRELWRNDLQRMKANGIETVRVFEFAWSVVEPREGEWDFSLFDDFLALAAEEKMQVIMCTPSATPPAWLTHSYPEVLNARMDGVLLRHGHRRHYNYNSPVYRRFVSMVVGKLAERYGDHPAVIGWQLDNEINCETNVFYSDADHAAFREWLKKRFNGSLDALNEAIGGRFWNQSYSAWAEVFLERPVIAVGNPHMALLEKAFISDSAISFAKMQEEILRPYIGKRFVTTNGMFGHLKNDQFTDEVLDFLCYDNYPNFAYGEAGINSADGGMRDRSSSYAMSVVRGFSPNFGIMEQQSGAQGWDHTMMSPMPLPGQMRLWTLQAVANGADFVSYFRWRTAVFGTEMYWHGILDYDNADNRRLREVGQIHEDLKKIAGASGSRYQAKVLLLTDWINDWDGERDKWYGPMSAAAGQNIFAAAQRSHTPLDILPWKESMTAEDLAAYDLVFVPHMATMSEEMAEVLKAYASRGGRIVLGARTGYKDRFGRCRMTPMPGPAADLAGVRVVEYSMPRPEEKAKIRFEGEDLPVEGFQESLQAVDSEVLSVYDSGWLAGEPGLTRKMYPEGGMVWYAGMEITEQLAAAMLKAAGVSAPYAEKVTCPPEVELAVRAKDKEAWYFVLNYTGEEKRIRTAEGLRPVIGGDVLPPYGVAVFKDSL